MKKLMLIVGLSLGLVGCADVVQQTFPEALSESTYATGDALDVNRPDLAKPYNAQAERLVPPPKKRIDIGANNPKTAQQGINTVTTDTDKQLQANALELTKLTQENNDLKKQVASSSKWFYFVLAEGLTIVILITAFIAWKLKWFGL